MGLEVEDVGAAVRAAGDSEWSERFGRIGLATRGVTYVVVAALAAQVAQGADRGPIDREGALRAVGRQPMGRFVLLVMAAGFGCYALWRLVKAATGATEGGSPKEGAADVAARLADVVKAALYVTGMFSALHFAFDGDQPTSDGNTEARSWSARLLEMPAGRALVVAVGLGLIAAGVVIIARSVMGKHDRHLERYRMTDGQRRWLPRLGTIGRSARGGVFVLVGTFTVRTGWRHRPDDAVGIDGALRRLLGESHGPGLLMAVAAGLLAFGLYSLVEARWRRVLCP